MSDSEVNGLKKGGDRLAARLEVHDEVASRYDFV
jgi:hypothetical protein